MNDAGLPASSYIDIAPNEYVTKYSINRNFEKLLSNDFYLYEKYNTSTDSAMSPIEKLKKAQTYNKLKTYNAGDFVFYKIKKDDTKFYILSSAQGPNSHKPTVRKNVVTNDLYVVNSDWWVIVGIDPAKGGSLPKDQADMHVNDSLASFQANHERNTEELSAHPVQRLGMQQSEKAFRTLENISEDRQKFQYPSYLQSLVGDSTVYQGYMRKWDNGLLEYDLTFRLGYISSDTAGKDLISANSLVVPHRNKNYLYFKDDSDYTVFNKGGDGYVVTPNSKQVNLNPHMNAYTGTIKFPEPFKDLDYMVFTTNVKNVETEAYSLKSEAIPEHDKRLVIEGRCITGVAPSAVFLEPCNIPDKVVNIAYEALANIAQVDGFPVVFKADPWKSELINIEAAAFNSTEMSEISVPASVRYIGQGAFSNCQLLSCVNFFVYDDEPERQVRIDKDAFPRNVTKIRIYRKLGKTAAFAAQASHEQVFLGKKSLFDRLTDADSINYKAYIGLNPTDNYVSIEQIDALTQSLKPMAFTAATPITVDVVNSTAEDNRAADMHTIDVRAFLAELPMMRAEAAKKMMFAAAKPPVDLESVFQVNADNCITGFNDEGLPNRIGFDLNDMPDDRKPTGIASGALSGFNKLTGLTANPELTDIQHFSLPNNLTELSIQTASSKSYSIMLDNEMLIENDTATTTLTSMIQLDAVFANLSNAPESFRLNCGKIGELHTVGSIPSDAFYAPQINRLYVEQPNTIHASAFYNVSAISRCSITSHIFGTSICKHAFRYAPNSNVDNETDGTQAIDFDELTFAGSGWHISSDALQGVSIETLSIDLSASQFAANAWLDGSVSRLYIKNIGNAITSTFGSESNSITLSGFMAQSLTDVEIWTLAFSDISLFDLTSTYFPASTLQAIGLSDSMYIQGSDGKKFFNGTEYADDINKSYFTFTDEKWISGINSSALTGIEPIEMLTIPYETAGICADVLNMSKIANSKVKQALSAVDTIYIPNTVKAIGASAFYMLNTVEDIMFDNGIDLSAIGKDAFGGMSALNDFTVP